MDGSIHTRERHGLRMRVTVAIGATGLVVAALATVVMFVRFESEAAGQLERDGTLIAAQVAAAVGEPIAAGEPGRLAPLLARLQVSDDLLEMTVVDPSGAVVASTRPERVGRLAPPALRAPVRATGVSVRHEPDGAGPGEPAVLFVSPVRAAGQWLGSVAVRLPSAQLAAHRMASLKRGAIQSVVAVAAFSGLVYVLLGYALRPVLALQEAVERLASGRIDGHIDPASLGPLAGVGHALNRLGDAYRAVADHVASLSDRLHAASTRIAGVTADMQSASGEQAQAVDETTALLARIDSSVKTVTSEVEGLSRSTEEASSSVLEMGSSIDEVARSMDLLNQSVESLSSSSQETGTSIRRVAESADEVQRMAEETAASMMQMDRAIQQVSDHVRQATQLTEHVSASAEDGSRAVESTIEGIGEIRTLTLDARGVLERLATRISEIGEIVNVIGSINDETNLLSLNAAIIAAQAGEQGKAFAVVANHVKTLAQRTAGSTQEIERLIGAVQEESANALKAMEAGIGSVETGVERSRRAGEVLTQIRSSASDANTRVAEISRAAAEQERNSKHVAEAASRTSSMVLQISNAMAEQSAASEQVLQTSESALEVCRQVHRSTEEQRDSGRFITESITSISEMMRTIQASLADHAHTAGAVSESVEHVLDGARKSGAGVEALAAAVEELRSDADNLQDLLARLRPGAPENGTDARA